ncbi:hypothetical protein AVEN_152656-1 [Araneus ventricosus]|uniref:Uncharacterized protein n=1 Tax=Araneus ventricosus TaxID=182803 RepID=A0A4Y2HAS9_ARAVE|nr:hypothetical protein AVEN_152656-1 [Araneus ventricosus]
MDNSDIRVPSARAPSPMFGVEVTNSDAFTVRVENVVKFQSRNGAMRPSIDASDDNGSAVCRGFRLVVVSHLAEERVHHVGHYLRHLLEENILSRGDRI